MILLEFTNQRGVPLPGLEQFLGNSKLQSLILQQQPYKES